MLVNLRDVPLAFSMVTRQFCCRYLETSALKKKSHVVVHVTIDVSQNRTRARAGVLKLRLLHAAQTTPPAVD